MSSLNILRIKIKLSTCCVPQWPQTTSSWIIYIFTDIEIKEFISSYLLMLVLLTYANNVFNRKSVLSFNYYQKNDLRSTVLIPKSSCFLDRHFFIIIWLTVNNFVYQIKSFCYSQVHLCNSCVLKGSSENFIAEITHFAYLIESRTWIIKAMNEWLLHSQPSPESSLSTVRWSSFFSWPNLASAPSSFPQNHSC